MTRTRHPQLPESTRTPPRRVARAGAAGVATLVAAVGLGGTLAPTSAVAAPGAHPTVAHPALAAAASTGRRWPGHPDRYLLAHRVRPGETATSLAVRYHAWTRELVRLNHLGHGRALYVGRVVTIPVVVSAYRRAYGHGPASGGPSGGSSSGSHPHATSGGGWRHADLSRRQVAGVVRRTARRHAVPSSLALAIAWQESGWQQRRISSTGAIGVMQVMPDTGRWMRAYAGRPLHLRDTHDNVLAGVLTLRVLRASTKHDRAAIGAYYQGLGAVREHGLYRDTKAYVRSVRAIQSRLVRTGSPY